MRYKMIRSFRISALLLSLLLAAGCSKSGDAPKGADADHDDHAGEKPDAHAGEKAHEHAGEKPDAHAGEKPDEHGHEEKGKAAEGDAHDEHEEGIVEMSVEAFARSSIRTYAAALREMPAELETTGEVGFNQNLVAHVSPRVPGRVHVVSADLGDTVKAGQPLVVLDSIELGRARSEFLQAKAQHALAKQTLEREEKLLAEKIASEKEVQEARAAAQKASAEYDAADGQLRLFGLSRAQIQTSRHDAPDTALFPVSSPLGGVIIEKHVTLGELASPEKDLFTIADTSRLWIWIDLYERNLAQVHKDDDVSVQVDTYPGRVFRGKVTYIGDQVNTATRAVRARVDVDNPDRALKAGMFARVKLSDPHGADGKANGRKVLAIPASAVQRDGDKSIAFVQEAERRFERRELRVGASSNGFVEVLSGVKEGELVVIDGAFLLKSEAAKETMGGGHSH